MELRQVDIIRSPFSENRVRLAGTVAYDDSTYQPEVYWFDVPKECAEYLTETGNPWLALLTPLAATLGEPLRISKPVDGQLFQNVHELMLIWKRWHPHLKVVKVEAQLMNTKHLQSTPRTASFFSGGVDSFFTVLRHSDGADLPNRIKIDDLICVWGFDVPLSKSDEFNRMRDVLQKAASDLDKEFIDVATNLFKTIWVKSQWGPLSHGSALATIGLIFEKRYNRVLIPSTHAYDNLMPNGSHPLTDPLHSTSWTKIIHDGAGFDRVEKTDFISNSEVALRSLKVCWEGHSDKNCQACNKCYRTMMTLLLLGVLSRYSTLSESNFSIAKVKKIYSHSENDFTLLREVQVLALRKGRRDIARAIERGFKHSKRVSFGLRIAKWLNTKRFVWRWSKPLERRLLSKSLV